MHELAGHAVRVVVFDRSPAFLVRRLDDRRAPSRSISFVAGAVSMTSTLHEAPAIRAASATPWAAFPALTVQTPCASCSGLRCRMALYAPRILNEPIGCSVSSLR